MRVISLCPSNTEVMEYLGLTHLLVGVDDFSDWPASIESLPKLGPDLSINMDLVEHLEPDMVLASLSVPGMEKNVEALKKRGIPHLVLNPQSLTDIENDLITTAEVLGERERGVEVARQFRSRLEKVKKQSANQSYRPRLYWEWWPKPIFTPGKINWLTEISEAAGAMNIFENVELASVQTEWEDVISRKPDFICLAWVGVRKDKIQKSLVKKRTGFEELGFKSDDQILILEEELYCRPSPRLLDGLERLVDLIHRFK
ncbi:cobalamin-binding protein [Bacillus sp. ISL-40]|uniref:cobalamin-binding protein n=1 Tax=unclassified Bacillus (in: firmicutes) TaxID=185979 RepID=UPI001BE4F99D|nr:MULTISPECIES: cobalamin-binding protein [unclassified Bacillus (in: firmicutes)]MBT2696482.1 cobalamin-binding protein [Bacillus sp. ISL-40]MBT2723153.1 cobalamin-binding protein [Bacillus sp. ISL-46]MBT2741502.1 cobalamin-binding protein [Bacillus sp. ISL-77]